ncbi:nitrate reductase [Naegleria gruberi]|uniref:Nitrate reductase n=1 Tax=Naegleria gruberi TaxID=5762 RepID=D2V2C0_NAEGR|nr:nitrate reductase [Naegleria gruberi]EFC48873.1 nitrate reductase [Naegleria gruberi]|eukprot:XP_002681617.1 nitrate reductase [Naegleria gruberi strain NEG-M]
MFPPKSRSMPLVPTTSNSSSPSSTENDSGATKYFTREQVAEHCTEQDCWMICHGLVYDVTHYLNEHPGGVPLMMKSAGKDCTSDFEAMFHSPKARNILKRYKVGELAQAPSSSSYRRNLSANSAVPVTSPNNLLSPFSIPSGKVEQVNPYNMKNRSSGFKEPVKTQVEVEKKPMAVVSTSLFMNYKVMLVQNITHDTKVFTMKLPVIGEYLPLKPGQHIQIAFPDETSENSLLVRKYTPTNVNNRGYFELTVKLYPEGKMSQRLAKIKIGDVLSARGPFGMEDFATRITNSDNLIMICIGSGITPMYQMIKHVAKEREEGTIMKLKNMTLLYGNKTLQDAIFEKELTQLSKEVSNNNFDFIVEHKISRETPEDIAKSASDTSKNVRYSTGRMDQDYLKDKVGNLSNSLFLICGTDDFCNSTKQLLLNVGYNQSSIHSF